MPDYPGWNRDLRWDGQDDKRSDRWVTYPVGIHNESWGSHSEMLLVREVAMMLVMDRLTDKPDWHKKVFDDSIADRWRQEALAWPSEDLWNRIANIPKSLPKKWCPKMPKYILSKECVDYCILELRQKAEHFTRTGIVPTLDATHSIAKSDVLVPSELHLALREAFARLRADQAAKPDWHPNTNETVLDLVHPSMYPLVYDLSRFLPDEVVGVDDAIDKWAGKGDVIPRKPEWDKTHTAGSTDFDTLMGGSSVDNTYWSTIYQWLPANVKFTADGGVQFTSYINNLHPTKHRDVYRTIEKLVEKAIPMWDQCVAQNFDYHGGLIGAGRHKPRIVPDDVDDEISSNWDPKSVEEMLEREAAAQGEKAADQPGTPAAVPGQEASYLSSNETSKNRDAESDKGSDADSDLDMYDELDSNPDDDEDNRDYNRWQKTREPVQREPPPFSQSQVDYGRNDARTLREQFRDRGLQIIVKMASIELTPDQPRFRAGGWHVEGQMNEHIVATALYYFDSENITDSHLEFRTSTDYDQFDNWEVGQGAYRWMESSFGTLLGSGSGGACVQKYGSVLTPEGRLLAFPNVFQHRVSGFRLADPTKPGHRRFIALWLVDPFTRIISTANVPPQQAEWWAERALGALNKNSTLPPDIAQLLLERGIGGNQLAEAITAGAEAGEARLPPELLDMVRKELEEGLPMTRAEAEEHRLKLMAARSAFQKEARENWDSAEYNFCEH